MPTYFFTAILFTLALRCLWQAVTVSGQHVGLRRELFFAACLMFVFNGIAAFSVGV